MTRLALAGLLLLAGAAPAHAAEDVTAQQVDDWLVAYSVKRSSAEYPYVRLVADVRRVVSCESSWSAEVINGRRRGRAGEIGPLQFLPGSGSIFYQSEAAQAGWPMTDVEANVSAGVELIAAGYARHWSCF